MKPLASGQALLEALLAFPLLILALACACVAIRYAITHSRAESVAHAHALRTGRRLPGLEDVLPGTICPNGDGVSLSSSAGADARLLPAPFPSLGGRTTAEARVRPRQDSWAASTGLPAASVNRRSEVSVDCWGKDTRSGKKVRLVVRARVLAGALP